MIKEESVAINARIAGRVRELRARQGLSLEGLARKSGVSRSMLSLIERAESSPTAVILEKLAASLDVPLAFLFGGSESAAQAEKGPVARREEQPEWEDPESGYTRRNVSPPDVPQPMQITEVHFPGRARVAFDHSVRDVRIYQQIWVLEGVMEITIGKEHYRLRAGDCLAMQLMGATIFHNPTRKPARYAVVVASERMSRR